MSDTPPIRRCDICSAALPAHGWYVLRMDLFAEPSLPPVTTAELNATDYQHQIHQLIEQMSHLTSDDLQDQVHRRMQFRICPACQPRFLANPLGLPRHRRSADN